MGSRRLYECICGKLFYEMPATADNRDYLCKECFRELKGHQKEVERRRRLENAQWGRKRYKLVTSENWGWAKANFGWDEVQMMLKMGCFDEGDLLICGNEVFEVIYGENGQDIVKIKDGESQKYRVVTACNRV